MKHLIIGTGNLGLDLAITLRERGEEVVVAGYDRCDLKFHYPYATHSAIVDDLASLRPDTVWCCVGAGGPSNDVNSFLSQVDAHVKLPVELVDKFKEGTRFVFFSTAYLYGDEHGRLSRYAATKACMESALHGRKNVTIYRVGSLYGEHRPENTFLGKILAPLGAGLVVDLPNNLVAPTPTLWLAETVADLNLYTDRPDNYFGFLLSPYGSTTVHGWGRSIAHRIGLPELIKNSGKFDLNYPEDVAPFKELDQLDYDGWLSLWGNHGFRILDRLIREKKESVSATSQSQEPPQTIA